MSETDNTVGETPVEGTADAIRRQIDDILDKLEDEIEKLPMFVQMAANAAVGVLRQVIQIPDNIGGDVD